MDDYCLSAFEHPIRKEAVRALSNADFSRYHNREVCWLRQTRQALSLPVPDEMIGRDGRHISTHIVEVDTSEEKLLLLKAFFEEIYVAQFSDADERESLANMIGSLERAEQRNDDQDNYHALLACEAGRPVGGIMGDYLARTNAGFVEFIVVSPEHRQHGIATSLMGCLETVFRTDAAAAGWAGLDLLAAEVEDPLRTDVAKDTINPLLRLEIWARWGFSLLDAPYVQPALSARQSPVTSLRLVVKVLNGPQSLPATIVASLLHDYFRWAIRIERPETSLEFRTISEWLSRHRLVGLLNLADLKRRT